jgi:hypothetical protein
VTGNVKENHAIFIFTIEALKAQYFAIGNEN